MTTNNKTNNINNNETKVKVIDAGKKPGYVTIWENSDDLGIELAKVLRSKGVDESKISEIVERFIIERNRREVRKVIIEKFENYIMEKNISRDQRDFYKKCIERYKNDIKFVEDCELKISLGRLDEDACIKLFKAIFSND